MGMLQSENSKKPQGLYHHMGLMEHEISVILEWILASSSLPAACRDQWAAAQPPLEGSPLFFPVRLQHGKKLLQFIPKQWKLARLHKAAEDLAPLDSFIWDHDELD